MADAARLLGRAHGALALAFDEISRRSGCGRSTVDSGIAIYATGHPEAEFYNGVLRLSPSVDAGELIRRADTYFAGTTTGYTVWPLLGHDDDVIEAARTSGLQQGPDMPEMICQREPPRTTAPAGVVIAVVSTAAGVRDSSNVMAEAFSTISVPRDAWSVVWPDTASLADTQVATVLASEGGVPLAGAMVMVVDGVGEVLNVGTVPSARRRGLGGLVTRDVTRIAFEMGAEFVSLQATPFGISVYEALGYEIIGTYRWYVRRWD